MKIVEVYKKSEKKMYEWLKDNLPEGYIIYKPYHDCRHIVQINCLKIKKESGGFLCYKKDIEVASVNCYAEILIKKESYEIKTIKPFSEELIKLLRKWESIDHRKDQREINIKIYKDVKVLDTYGIKKSALEINDSCAYL
jgi:hypothetical protein